MPTASVAAKHFNGLGGTLGNQWTFVSTALVGTNSPVLYPHGQNRVPLVVIVSADDTANAAILQGVHTKDSISVQAATGYTFSIIAYFGPGPV